jgi:dUTP pyrophosphatase
VVKRLLKIKILKTDKDLPTPKYKHHGDAGMDLYSTETTNIQPGEIKGISTGIKIAIPLGYEMQIRPRSGLAVNHGISMINTPGTIDQGYRGIVHALLVNHGKEAYEIKRGERIAQAVFKKVEIVDLEEVNAWEEDTERGTGGFGSSGRF